LGTSEATSARWTIVTLRPASTSDVPNATSGLMCPAVGGAMMAICRRLTVNAVELSVAVSFDRLLSACRRAAIARFCGVTHYACCIDRSQRVFKSRRSDACSRTRVLVWPHQILTFGLLTKRRGSSIRPSPRDSLGVGLRPPRSRHRPVPPAPRAAARHAPAPPRENRECRSARPMRSPLYAGVPIYAAGPPCSSSPGRDC